jgi:hypothetical protein
MGQSLKERRLHFHDPRLVENYIHLFHCFAENTIYSGESMNSTKQRQACGGCIYGRKAQVSKAFKVEDWKQTSSTVLQAQQCALNLWLWLTSFLNPK